MNKDREWVHITLIKVERERIHMKTTEIESAGIYRNYKDRENEGT